MPTGGGAVQTCKRLYAESYLMIILCGEHSLSFEGTNDHCIGIGHYRLDKV